MVAVGLPLGDLNLVHIEVLHVGCQSSEALAAAAPDPQQQGMTPGQADDPAHSGHMLHCIQEHDQAHGSTAGAVVVLQVLLHHLGAHYTEWEWIKDLMGNQEIWKGGADGEKGWLSIVCGEVQSMDAFHQIAQQMKAHIIAGGNEGCRGHTTGHETTIGCSDMELTLYAKLGTMASDRPIMT